MESVTSGLFDTNFNKNSDLEFESVLDLYKPMRLAGRFRLERRSRVSRLCFKM